MTHADAPERPDAALAAPAFEVLPDSPALNREIEALYDQAFGPGRHAKAAGRVREQAGCHHALSHVARDRSGGLVGACRIWAVSASQTGPALFLGPIAVRADARAGGAGLALTRACIASCEALSGLPLVLVGERGFFARAGFEPVPRGTLALPWPVDPARILWRAGAGGGPAPRGLLTGQPVAPRATSNSVS